MSGFQTGGGLDSLLNRPRPNKRQQFLNEPCLYLARQLYQLRTIRHLEPSEPLITVICVSDTHNKKPEIPPGEVLVHAGDSTQSGTLEEFQTTVDWLDEFPHRHKILIGGNHDLLLDPKVVGQDPSRRASIEWRSIVYLENEAVTLRCAGGRRITMAVLSLHSMAIGHFSTLVLRTFGVRLCHQIRIF